MREQNAVPNYKDMNHISHKMKVVKIVQYNIVQYSIQFIDCIKYMYTKNTYSENSKLRKQIGIKGNIGQGAHQIGRWNNLRRRIVTKI